MCSEFGTDVDNSIDFPLKWKGRHVASENTNDNSLWRESFAAHQCGTIYFLSHVKLCVSKHKLLNCELTAITCWRFSYRQPDKAQSCLSVTSPASPKASSSSSHVGFQDGWCAASCTQLSDASDTPQLESTAQTHQARVNRTDIHTNIHRHEDRFKAESRCGRIYFVTQCKCARPDVNLETEVAACREVNGVSRNVCLGQNERHNRKLMYWTYLW
jgi:hypothetical protein